MLFDDEVLVGMGRYIWTGLLLELFEEVELGREGIKAGVEDPYEDEDEDDTKFVL